MKMLSCVNKSVLELLVCLILSSGSLAVDPWLDPNLPSTVQPLDYTLWFYPDFYYSGATFYGTQRINIEILQDTNTIIIHYKMMNITKTTLVDSQNNEILLSAVFGYDANEYWVIQTETNQTTGTQLTLLLDFNGSLLNGIVGYYKSTYIDDVTGQQHWLATTKFQPSDARKAFPHFDEPRFKTPFTITLKHWHNFTALANMLPQTVVDIDSVWRETTFQKSPPMSSYLVCFIVCDFAFQNNTLQNGIPHRVWARSDRIQQTDYALWAGPIVQNFYVEEFGTPYPLPKLDQFGVPDYPSGATEHWGLITYRDTRLLVDPLQVSDQDKQNTLAIIAHEISHNHVGDLVTCLYWDELWLNEGLASFYEVKGVNTADPTMYYDGQFYSRTIQPVMDTDAGNFSHALVIEINSPNEANAVFDSITYDKGAAILGMMEGFLGTELFRNGIRRFIADNAYRSVTSEDLWRAFQTEIGSTSYMDIKAIMSQWIYIMGYPVIEISPYSGNHFNIKQRRFMMNPTADPDSPPTELGYLWYVPLNYRTKSGKTGLIWLNMTANENVPTPTPNETEWIKFNYDHTGFYRVNYAAEQWQLLIQQLYTNHLAFSDRERSNLLSDAMNLARAAQLSYSVTLDLTKYLAPEYDLLPWDTALATFSYISGQLFNDTQFSQWQKYIDDLSYSLLLKLGVVDEGSHVDKLNRKNVIKISCDSGNTECLQNTTKLFTDWLQDELLHSVPVNIRREVYAFGMRATGDEESWTTVWNRYMASTSGQEKDNLLYSLSCTTDLTLIDRLLQYSMDESKIRSQDFFNCISYIAANREANDYCWHWIQNNYENIVARFGLDNRSLGKMVPDIVDGYNTEQQLLEVEAFFAKYPDAGTGERYRQEAIQSIRTNIDWLSRSRDDIFNWLQQQQPAVD